MLVAGAGPMTGLFTDGGASPNPGPGGWGYVLVEDGTVIAEDYGSNPQTTNNRMELTAIIAGLKILPKDASITLYSDSNLCVQTLNSWAANWEKKGWKRKEGPIANLDLVQEAYELAREHPKVTVAWIKAHNGWHWNEYADSLATKGRLLHVGS